MLQQFPAVRRSLLYVAAAAAALPFAGCGDGSAKRAFTVTPALTFAALTTGASAPQSAVIANNGVTTVHVNSVTITGANASSFSTGGSTCTGDLAPAAQCSVPVTFSAGTPGSYGAALTVQTNANFGGTQQVALSGTATAPTPAASFSASSLTLTPVTAGGTSSATVTLTSNGTAPLALTAPTLSGTGANLFTQSTTCGSTLAIGASCTVTVGFKPLVPGTYTGTLNLPNNAGGTQSVALTAVATPSAITIDTTVATDWKINTGAFSIDFNPTRGNIYSMTLNSSGTQLVDTTTLNSDGKPKGFYMDNAGFGTATPVPGYSNVPATGSMPAYLDWWVTYPSSATNAYTYAMHWVVTANDPGLHVYFVANHAATDIAGSIGQVQWAFRDSLTAFTNTYAVDPSVNNPGVTTVPLPTADQAFSTDPGRAVQDATVDLHGFNLPAGFTRSFYTKYDHDGYEYLHRAHGLYGNTLGIWTVLPSSESLVGGPTKQDLYFTGNLLMIEAYSNHLDNPLTLATPFGTKSSRLFGPYYVRFNGFGQAYTTTGNTLSTPADLYADALSAGSSFGTFYDNEPQLTQAGYVPSTARGKVSVQVNGIANLGSTATKAAWAVLSDPGRNFQFSSAGAQYWADVTTAGVATFNGVAPGTYRLSVFVLGQFGEYRRDGIVVNAGGTTTVPTVNFTPENFGTAVFTLGTPDRSSHEFLHGHDSKGFDDKEYWGTFNYWQDFASNNGAVVYNATGGPAGPATNDLSKWNYNHWGVFNPGLYNAATDKTDNYTNTIPGYVASLPGASGTNGVTTRTPVWTVHFATPQNAAQYNYAVVSVALACDYGSYVLSLNGTARIWSYRNGVASDCAIRSGLSGYYQWVAFQFPASALTAAGNDNVLTIGVSQTYGAMDDAIRLELTNTSAAPSSTGWNDYEFVGTSSTAANLPANDTTNNQ